MREERDAPILGKIRKSAIANQVAYTVTVAYPDEEPSVVTFVGTSDGAPIVMVTPGNPGGMFVSRPERFGEFGPEWVRRFFS